MTYFTLTKTAISSARSIDFFQRQDQLVHVENMTPTASPEASRAHHFAKPGTDHDVNRIDHLKVHSEPDVDHFLASNLTLLEARRHTHQRPLSWYWTPDLPNGFQATLRNLGFTPVRLVRYQAGSSPGTAALFHKRSPQSPRAEWHTVDSTQLSQTNRSGSLKAESLCFQDSRDGWRASVLASETMASSTRVHVGLDRSTVQALQHSGLPIVELVPHVVDGEQRFAAITDAEGPPSLVLTGATSNELMYWIKERKLVLSLLRRYVDGGDVRFAAVAQHSSVRNWSWWVDADADTLANKVKSLGGYLVDLDAYFNDRGMLRFSAVMYRWRT